MWNYVDLRLYSKSVIFAWCVTVSASAQLDFDSPQDLGPVERDFEVFGQYNTPLNLPPSELAMDAYHKVRASCSWDNGTDAWHSDGFDYSFFNNYEAMQADRIGVTLAWLSTPDANVPSSFVDMISLFHSNPQRKHRVTRKACVATNQQKQEWRIKRYGPFSSTGGNDWHRFTMMDIGNLQLLLSKDEQQYVTAFLLAPISAANGSLLPLPPYHIHHANLAPRSGHFNFSRLGEWHGDSQCLQSEGGVNCYLRSLPPGYAFPLNVPLDLSMDLNDVREKGSEKVEFWIEVAIQIIRPNFESESIYSNVGGSEGGDSVEYSVGHGHSKKGELEVRSPGSANMTLSHRAAVNAMKSTLDPNIEKTANTKDLRPMGVIVLDTPCRMHWWNPRDYAAVMQVPTNTPSAIWSTGQWPTSGTMVAGHHYTHQMLVHKILVFADTTPEQLGLNRQVVGWGQQDETHKTDTLGESPRPQDEGANAQLRPNEKKTVNLVLRRPWEAFVPREHGLDTTTFLETIESHIQRNFARHVKRFESASRSSNYRAERKRPRLIWVLNETAMEKEAGHMYARQMQWPKQPWQFEQGAEFTVVMLHRNMHEMQANAAKEAAKKMSTIEVDQGVAEWREPKLKVHSGHSAPKASNNNPKYIQQHLGFHGYYIPADQRPAEYHYLIMTSTNPGRWQWLDRPNLFLLFTHFGGPPTHSWSLFGMVCLILMLGALLFSAGLCTAYLILPCFEAGGVCADPTDMSKISDLSVSYASQPAHPLPSYPSHPIEDGSRCNSDVYVDGDEGVNYASADATANVGVVLYLASVRRILRLVWSVGTPQKWKQRAGRKYGRDGYRPGDLTRTFVRNAKRATGNLRRRTAYSHLKRRKDAQYSYELVQSYDPCVNQSG